MPEHYGCNGVGPWSGEHAFTLADEAARTIGIIDCSDSKLHLVGHSYDLVDTPADVSISEREVHVPFHRRAHLPIIIASGILNAPVRVTWCVTHCA